MSPAVIHAGDRRLSLPWRPSRAGAVALLGAAHVLLVYLLVTLGPSYVIPSVPFVEPILGSLGDRHFGPISPLPRTNFKPKLARVEISPTSLSDFHLIVPTESTPNVSPDVGSSGPGESTPSVISVARPSALTTPAASEPVFAVSHYVAPVYPAESARLKEEGVVAIAALVNAQGTVDDVKILSSTGSSRLDEAAINAVRQWVFTPVETGSGGSAWAHVKVSFAPPTRVLGVPLMVIPYREAAHDLEAKIPMSQDRNLPAPSTQGLVRSMIEKLTAAYPSERGEALGQSLEAKLGRLGPLETLDFLGYVDHGIERDQRSSNLDDPRQFDRTRWEVYAVKQAHGSSTWLVAVSHGSIQRIEAVVR